MEAEVRRELIERYRSGTVALAASLAGITESELDIPVEDGWTPRQVVHHLADSEMTSAIRLRRLVAEESPAIIGYDQDEFARRLHYDRPIESSLALVRASRDTSLEILERLDDSDWERAGSHSEIGTYPIGLWLRIYSEHVHEHAEQIQRARRTAHAEPA